MRREVIGNAELWLGDCREVLPTLSGVDVILTDPPYGDGYAANPLPVFHGGKRSVNHAVMSWDDQPVDLAPVLKLDCVQIIWGGNRYPLPPCRGWLSWFKPDAPPSMGHFELAWTNIDRTARQISCSIAATNAERAGHPTQKPVRVMQWCLEFALSPGIVCDPFMGSGTTGVACTKLGRGFIGCEIDPGYFEIACRRIEAAYRQRDLFVADPPRPAASQATLFTEAG